jgi:hypothetical protein
MKTFDEFTRKFFLQNEPAGDDSGDGDDSEFVIPECWKPKTFFQSSLLSGALNKSNRDVYSSEFASSLSNCINDFWDQHTTHKTEIIFDGNLNFTVTEGESSATASSAQFPIGLIPNLMEAIIKIDGKIIPRTAPITIPPYTGMLAELSVKTLEIGGSMCSVELSKVDADTFTDGEHYVVISLESYNLDLEPKTYKELAVGDGDKIIYNKMLPKTPEELAFALLIGLPVEFTDEPTNPKPDPEHHHF